MKAGITNRTGNFNTALHAGGDPASAIINRKKLCRALGADFDEYTCAEQTHGSHVHTVVSEDRGSGRYEYGDSIPDSDALITGTPGILLNIHVADCVPLVLFEPERRIAALVHSGWRGTAGLIAGKTASIMISRYNCDPEAIVAAIGPSIGSCCYDIGSETAEALTKSFFYREPIIMTEGGRITADLKNACLQQLTGAGIRRDNIEISDACTSCMHDRYFSYRADGDRTGRFSAFVLIK